MKFTLTLATLAVVCAAVLYTPLHPAGLIPRSIQARDYPALNQTNHKVLVGAAGQILGYDFNGSAFIFNPKANISEPGKVASWLTFKQPNLLYANDENSNATRLFNYDPETGELSNEISSFNGSSGVVHLEFTTDKQNLIGSSYGQGQIDIWDSSDPKGSLKLVKQVPLPGNHGPNNVSQTQPRAHQTVMDPTGRFFVINDLGGDALHILDSLNSSWTITGSIPVTPPGAGPRHGVFISLDGHSKASHYIVVNELVSTMTLFQVNYTGTGLSMTNVQTISTFGDYLGPASGPNARAGEIMVSHVGPVQIYVSNRFTNNQTDSISRFVMERSGNQTAEPGKVAPPPSVPILKFKGVVGTGGSVPRHMSLSKDKDESIIFVANTNGQNGLWAFDRCARGSAVNGTCKMSAMDLGKVDNTKFTNAQGKLFGPQFVAEF